LRFIFHDTLKKMKINHEETKGMKKDQKKLRVLRFFVVVFVVDF